MKWHKHLCEYYNVTKEEAIQLGTRSTGRKPNLPGSPTCDPVSEKTFEDIWGEKERKTTKSVFDFYKDQGAWSVFRQCVRHKDLESLHIAYLNFLSQNSVLKTNVHICEYGSGVAPFMTTFLKYLEENTKEKIKITLCDVDSEHFNFSKYRLNNIKEERKLDGISLFFEEVKPEKLPIFNSNLDVVFCFEVLEHVPSPLKAIQNITSQLNYGGLYIENFIKHDHDHHDDDGPDLPSAKNERESYYRYLNEKYTCIVPEKYSDNEPNITRIWQKKLF